MFSYFSFVAIIFLLLLALVIVSAELGGLLCQLTFAFKLCFRITLAGCGDMHLALGSSRASGRV